ncbi:MAG: TonB-dependent receptor [Cetobacterium sp.]|uniref:TonB-dependent receptor family protein n=1 Tax=Cetobacterium sp. TaxID=2071632 RepID=UPI002FCA1F4C
MNKKILLAASLILLCNSVMAEEKTYVQRLEDTIVSGENFEVTVIDTPKNVTIITSEELEQRGVKNISEALKSVPSLIVTSMSGTDPTFDLRGQGATAKSNVLVLLDGIPLNTIDLSGYKTNQIDISQVSRIEVVPAGGAVLYGDGAVGGLINIITKGAENRKNYGTVGIEAGSYDLLKFYGNYGTKITDNLLVEGRYSTKNMHGYRENSKDDLDTIDFQAKYLLKDGFISLGAGRSKNSFHAPGALTLAEYNEDREQMGDELLKGINTEKQYNLKMEKRLSTNLEFMIYGNHRTQDYTSSRFYKANPSWNYGREYKTTLDYVKPQIKYSYRENDYLILGADYLNGKTDVKGTGESKKESTGIFALNKFNVSKFELTQGYRKQFIDYDYFENGVLKKKKFKEDALELAANYLINDTSSTYISYTSAFRTPNTDEIGYWAQNEEIKPQTSNTIEIGGKTIVGNTYISAAIFNISTENEIIFGRGDETPTQRNRNIDGKTDRIGGEIFLEHYFDKLTLRETFSYIHHEIKDGAYEGKEIPGVPNYMAGLGATYLFTEKLTFNTDLNYYGSYYSSADFDNEGSRNDAYTVLNVSLNYEFGNGVSVYGGINNIANESYSDYVNFSSYSKTTSYYPAAERNFYAGARYTF